jgi:hypothetical protein
MTVTQDDGSAYVEGQMIGAQATRSEIEVLLNYQRTILSGAGKSPRKPTEKVAEDFCSKHGVPITFVRPLATLLAFFARVKGEPDGGNDDA